MPRFEITDHTDEVHAFSGELLFEFHPPGHDCMGDIHALGGALYVLDDPPERLAAHVALPGSTLDRGVTTHRHVLVADRLGTLLAALDELDVMQHNNMPHWTGHCALLDSDLAQRLDIHVALSQAKAEFMQRCRDAVKERSDLRGRFRR
jgi:hypothetical protein